MNRIDKLLDKYWEGRATIAEEQELREYFSASIVSAHHLPFRKLFLYEKSASKNIFSENFDEALLAELESRNNNPTVSLIDAKQTKSRPLMVRHWLGVAATIVLLIVVGIGLQKTPPPENLADIPHLIVNGKVYQPATKEEAYKLTRQALQLVSAKMKKSKSKKKKINK